MCQNEKESLKGVFYTLRFRDSSCASTNIKSWEEKARIGSKMNIRQKRYAAYVLYRKFCLLTPF